MYEHIIYWYRIRQKLNKVYSANSFAQWRAPQEEGPNYTLCTYMYIKGVDFSPYKY